MTTSSERSGAAGVEDPVGRVPDFFIVGHHKSGTTAMYEMLRAHSQIFMPRMKEPEFFGRDRARHQQQASRDSTRQTFGGSRPRNFAEYLALFDAAKPDQIVGEASPSYLRSSTAASQIAEAQPAARIIAILREPASFLRSLHLQMVRNHVQSEPDLEKAILHEGVAADSGRVVQYTDRVRYVEQLGRYHAVLPSEQILVLIYDDFRADNEAAMRTVLSFLEVDADAPIPLVDANPTIAPRSRALDSWVHRLRSGRGPVTRRMNTAFKALTPERARRRTVRAFQRNVVYRNAPPADPAFTNELRRRFKPEVVALSEYLDRDLVKLWGYDQLG
jgi:Sulfotransferase family